jgi:hypothetical protein
MERLPPGDSKQSSSHDFEHKKGDNEDHIAPHYETGGVPNDRDSEQDDYEKTLRRRGMQKSSTSRREIYLGSQQKRNLRTPTGTARLVLSLASIAGIGYGSISPFG